VDNVSIDIELFSSSACPHCQRASHRLEQLRQESGFANIAWRSVDVVAEIDRAVALGVLSTPAIAIGGKLVFTSLPTRQQLRDAVQNYLSNKESDDE